MKYFSNLPVIPYSNNYVRNILTRVKFIEKYKQQSQVYYPYIQSETKDNFKHENIAYNYYDDTDDVWVIHLFNDIIDPYYDVPLTQENFDNFIIKKYGSIRNAHQTVLFYRNNYDQDDSIISESDFNNLPEVTKRYWYPTEKYDNTIIGYERQKENLTITTNKIISFQITITNDKEFIIGEKVIMGDSSGFVTYSNSSIITLQHIRFFVDEDENIVQSGTIIGDSSLTTAEITTGTLLFNAFSGLNNSMSPNEEVYFSQVTAYDYENELNEQKKNLKILNRQYLPEVQSYFTEIVNDAK